MTTMGSMKSSWNSRRAFVLAAILTAAACGTKSTSPTSTPPTLVTAVNTTTITITSAGVSPNNIEVAVGARVLFINSDSRAHNMTSDPHPEHTDCTAINSVGFLQAGQQLTTGNLTTIRTCKYHDHDDPSNNKLQGQITIK
jgi:plastocyanin